MGALLPVCPLLLCVSSTAVSMPTSSPQYRPQGYTQKGKQRAKQKGGGGGNVPGFIVCCLRA